MTYTRKLFFLSSISLLFITGCDFNISSANYDSGKNTIEKHGKIYYHGGELFGITKEKQLKSNDTYEIISVNNGKVIGQISLDHTVLGKDNGNFIYSECIPNGDNDFDEDNYLIGSCTMAIDKLNKGGRK